MKKEDKEMPASDADKTLKIRRPWSPKRLKALKWGAIGAAALVLSAVFLIVLQARFCGFNEAVQAAFQQPKDSGPAAGPMADPTPAPADTPTAPTEKPKPAVSNGSRTPSGPTVVIEVPKPIGFDASSCRRSQWKRTKRGFLFDIRCVRIIHPQPRQGR